MTKDEYAETASTADLDAFALQFGLYRFQEETDARLRQRLLGKLRSRSAGSRHDIAASLLIAVPDAVNVGCKEWTAMTKPSWWRRWIKREKPVLGHYASFVIIVMRRGKSCDVHQMIARDVVNNAVPAFVQTYVEIYEQAGSL